MSDYIKMYQQLHKRPNRFRGVSTRKHTDDIKALIKETDAKTLLDFGCGKGLQYTNDNLHNEWGGIMPTLYDPGVPNYSTKPSGTWDGVICTDVMEHIPEDETNNVIKDILTRADKFAFINICTVPAGVFLPNGENAHVTIKPHEWWVEKIDSLRVNDAIILIESRSATKNIKPEHITKTRL